MRIGGSVSPVGAPDAEAQHELPLAAGSVTTPAERAADDAVRELLRGHLLSWNDLFLGALNEVLRRAVDAGELSIEAQWTADARHDEGVKDSVRHLRGEVTSLEKRDAVRARQQRAKIKARRCREYRKVYRGALSAGVLRAHQLVAGWSLDHPEVVHSRHVASVARRSTTARRFATAPRRPACGPTKRPRSRPVSSRGRATRAGPRGPDSSDPEGEPGRDACLPRAATALVARAHTKHPKRCGNCGTTDCAPGGVLCAPCAEFSALRVEVEQTGIDPFDAEKDKR